MPKIREPAVAGSFYPGSAPILKREIEKYLNNASVEKIKGKIKCLIAPHAGYMYSGPVAAYAYKTVSGQSFEVVVVLAPSHRAYFKGAAVFDGDYYRTPLGDVLVDKEICQQLLAASPNFSVNEEADRFEHSLEVQVPFLQEVLKDFKLVPIIIGDFDFQKAREISQTLVEVIGQKNVLVVASSDLSHFHPADRAKNMDLPGLKSIEDGNIKNLIQLVSNRQSELCGFGPVLITMYYAEKIGAKNIKLLKYSHSGEVTGDDSGVVGYGAVVFSQEGGQK